MVWVEGAVSSSMASTLCIGYPDERQCCTRENSTGTRGLEVHFLETQGQDPWSVALSSNGSYSYFWGSAYMVPVVIPFTGGQCQMSWHPSCGERLVDNNGYPWSSRLFLRPAYSLHLYLSCLTGCWFIYLYLAHFMNSVYVSQEACLFCDHYSCILCIPFILSAFFSFSAELSIPKDYSNTHNLHFLFATP